MMKQKYIIKIAKNQKRGFLMGVMILYYFFGQAQVSLTATTGTATGSFTTLSAAFAALNAGTHGGNVNITITANTSEPFTPTTLIPPPANGWTTLNIAPQGANIVVTSTGINTNRGLVELFNVKNVTIDGDDPNASGVRNLSFIVPLASPNATSAIRIGATNTTVFAENITIRNCIIRGGRQATPPSSTANFGISISNANTAISPANASGVAARAINIENNEIYRAHNAIFSFGATTVGNSFAFINVKGNIIGSTTDADAAGQTGITFIGSSSITGPSIIEKNQIKAGSNVNPLGWDVIGIDLQNYNPSVDIFDNEISDIINNNTSTGFNVVGIRINGIENTNIEIWNNIVRDVITARKTATTGANSSYALFVAGVCTNLIVNHNTFGLIAPNSASFFANYYTSTVLMNTSSSVTQFTNNIVVNNNTSANALCLTILGTGFTNTVFNNNCYFSRQGGLANGFATLNLWQAGTGRDPASFVEYPPFISATNLRMQTSPIPVTRCESRALASSVGFDIDGEFRPGPTGSPTGKDIGADEFEGLVYQRPSISVIQHTRIGAQSCFSTSSYNVTTAGLSLGNASHQDSVILEYNVNGGAPTRVQMTPVNVPAGIFNQIIPPASPAEAIVAYRIFVLTRVGDTVFSNFNYYTDFIATSSLKPTITSTPPVACVNSTVTIQHSFSPDPTGVIFPAQVVNPTLLSDISQVTFTGITNTTAGASLNGTIGAGTGIAGAYSNFRNITFPTYNLGQSYPFSLTSIGSNAASKDYFAAFIDFNGDGDFGDAGEMVFNTIWVPNNGSRTETGFILIRPDARPGTTTIRFMVSNTPILNAAATINSGEVEDYTIVINPLTYRWVVNSVDSGTTNPKSLVTTTIPTSVVVEVTDAQGCKNTSSPYSINASTGTLTVTISAPTRLCYNTSTNIVANVTGGCPPYTYSWSNNPSNNSRTSSITMLNTAVGRGVTVTDLNGFSAIDTFTVLPDTPKLGALTYSPQMCNRGSTVITANNQLRDSVLWYDDPNASPLNFLFKGKNYTTPTLNASKTFYAAAFRTDASTIGRVNNTGAAISSLIQNNVGLRFNTTAPIIIHRVSLYMAGAPGATIRIGVLDKYGSIIAQTSSFAPTFATGAPATPTVVTLDLSVPIPDIDYRLVILDMQGITTMNRNTNISFPISSGQAMVITGPFNMLSTAALDYNFFYNIQIQRNICVGEKKSITAVVQIPITATIDTDLVYTQTCRGSDTALKIVVNNVGNRFVWYKDGAVWQDSVIGSFLQDTSLRSRRVIPKVKPSDTGYYQVRIFSTVFCTRDTFSRIVKLALFPEAKILSQPLNVNMCLLRNHTLSVNEVNTFEYKWQKIAPSFSTIQTGPVAGYDLSNADFNTSGDYRVIVQDIRGCIPDTSKPIKVQVFDTPQITMHPRDTTLCEGSSSVLRAKALNTTKYQWYKDNGIIPFFESDTYRIFNATKADSGLYRLHVTSYPGCPQAVSNFALVRINPVPKVSGIYPDLTICEGNKMRVTANARDNAGLQWYKGSTFLGITTDTLVVLFMNFSDSGKYYFKAIALNTCPNVNSDTFKVSVKKRATISGFVRDTLICSGIPFRAAYSTANTTTYQWYKNLATLQSETDSIFSLDYTDIRDTGIYYVSINSHPACPEVISPSFRLKIQHKVEITTQPLGDTLCQGSNYTMTVIAKNASGYEWRKASVTQPNGSTPLFKINNLNSSNEGNYEVFVKGIAPCGDVLSNVAPVLMKSGATNAFLTLNSNYDAVEQCTDADDWTYYSPSDNPEKFIFAIRKNGNQMRGKADVIIQPNLLERKINDKNGYNGTLMLNRFWNYKVDTGEFIEPIDVKFYYDDDETNALEAKVNNYKQINITDTAFTFTSDQITWFKSDSIPFKNSLLSEIVGEKLNFPNTVLTGEDGNENNIDYVIFYGVKNIGGGTGKYTFKSVSRVISSILENQNLSSSIYPNPSNGDFKIQLYSKFAGDLQMEIYDALGKRVYEDAYKITKNYSELTVSVDGLSNGIYQISLKMKDQVSLLKLQIER